MEGIPAGGSYQPPSIVQQYESWYAEGLLRRGASSSQIPDSKSQGLRQRYSAAVMQHFKSAAQPPRQETGGGGSVGSGSTSRRRASDGGNYLAGFIERFRPGRSDLGEVGTGP